MDISTSMEIGHILIALISLLLFCGLGSIVCSIIFDPYASVNNLNTQRKTSTINKTTIKKPLTSDPLSDFMDEELEMNEDLFDD